MRAEDASTRWASLQVAAVRDDPAGRLELLSRTYSGPFGHTPQRLPFRLAALAFMRWQLRRGVLSPPTARTPGSPWWRAVNERLLLDGCESVALSGGLPGTASSHTVERWLDFI